MDKIDKIAIFYTNKYYSFENVIVYKAFYKCASYMGVHKVHIR